MIIHRGRSVGPDGLRGTVLSQLGHHARVQSEESRVLVKRRAEAVYRLKHLDRRHVMKEAEKQAMGLSEEMGRWNHERHHEVQAYKRLESEGKDD